MSAESPDSRTVHVPGAAIDRMAAPAIARPQTSPAGWYEDPRRPGLIRYWNGKDWVGDAKLPPGRPLNNAFGIVLYENEVWKGTPGAQGSIGGSLVGARADVGTEGQITQRITATRLVALGVFALAAPKRGGNQTALLHVEAPTFEFIHAAAAAGNNRAFSSFANIAQYINNRRIALAAFERPQTTTQSPAFSVADEILKLSELRDRGILTPEEFEQQKAALLRR